MLWEGGNTTISEKTEPSGFRTHNNHRKRDIVTTGKKVYFGSG